MESIRLSRSAILCFETILGLRVNLSKSSLYLVGIVTGLEDLVSTFGCSVESLPTFYLGLRLEYCCKDISV